MRRFPARSTPLSEALIACRSHVRGAALFSALINLLYLAPSIYMLQVYDRVVPTRGAGTLLLLTLMLLAATLTAAGLELTRARLLVRAGARLDRLLAPPALAAVLDPRGDGGRLRPIRDLDTLRQAIAGAGLLALFDMAWAPIYIAVCFLLHPALGALALAGALLLIGLAALNERASGPVQQAASGAQNGAMQRLEATVMLSAGAGILATSPALLRRHLADRERASIGVATAALVASPYVTAARSSRQLLQSLAVGLGALLAIEQSISLGSIFAASLLVARALAPIEQITASWKSLALARIAYRALAALPPGIEEDQRPMLPTMRGAIAVDRLSVAGVEGDAPFLRGIGFDLPAGETLGVVGPNGAGKSTLARALVGLAVPATGAVRIDGAALGDWREDQRTMGIGYVPQEPHLLAGSIADNICGFATAEGTDALLIQERVIRAAMLSGAHDMICRQPGSYARLIGGGHGSLSLGQKQRIAITRAVYGDPSLAVLDEPYMHLDGEGEAMLTRMLSLLRERGTTVVLVAHRLSLLERCDRLLLLREGTMEAYGPARDLLAARLRAPAPKLEDAA